MTAPIDVTPAVLQSFERGGGFASSPVAGAALRRWLGGEDEPGERLHAPGYESLAHTLRLAFDQATTGKGADRHAQGLPFADQPMQKLCALYGVGFALGQAGKKMQEAQRLPRDAAIRELLGAINYAAGAIVFLEGPSA